jgi:hypothetical protein
MDSRAAAHRAILVLALLCAGLAGACLLLWRRAGGPDERPLAERALEDPELRRAAIAELVARGSGVWDTFPDPDVGVLLQPDLQDRPFFGTRLSSNSRGLRERSYALPKPAGTVRVVLLGDSFVMGQSVEVEQRLGARLERHLLERAGREHGPVEVLHLGINTWNVQSEAAFVRRQVSLLLPDLLVHLVVRNDLEDSAGARGFGEMSNVSPAHPERGEMIFQAHFPALALGARQPNWLHHGFDWESRSRFEAAGAAIGRLARDVEALGGRYLLLDYYTGLLPVSRRHLARELSPRQVAFLPTALIQDERYRISAQDAHWNAAGHELVAELLYALVVERALLPQLAPSAWPEASALAADWLARGEKEAAAEPDADRLPGRRTIEPAVDFSRLDDERAAQVNGGVIGGAFVAPYASVILRAQGRRRLTLSGVALDRRELEGVRLDVLADEAKVGEVELRSGRGFEATFEVPAEIARRTFVSARFSSSDFAYDAGNARLHVAWRIRRVALD